MKAQMLKIAGVKTEKAFYKKYPTEEAFFKAHPDAKKLVKPNNSLDVAEYGGEYPIAQTGANLPWFSPGSPFFSVNNITGLPSSYTYPQQTSVTPYNPNQPISGAPLAGANPSITTQGGNTEFSTSFNSAMPNLMGSNQGFDFNKWGNAAGGLLGAAKSYEAERLDLNNAKQAEAYSKVFLEESRSRDVDEFRQVADNIKKKKDAIMQPISVANLFPNKGVGTNPLTKNGRKITKAQFGAMLSNAGSSALGGFLGGMGGNLGGMFFNNNAGSQAGGAIGGLWGPGGAALGSFAGGAIDQAFGFGGMSGMHRKNAQRNMQNGIINNFGKHTQGMFSPNLKDGGWVSNDWNPQVISKFGDHTAEDYYDFAHEDMDTLRAGGNIRGEYTPVSERGLKTYALGGELKVHNGGYAETLANNPFLPGDGEIIMFRGRPHTRGGMDITYANNPVNVEGGEPMVQLADGGEIDPVTGKPQNSGVVFGNLVDPTTGVKFKKQMAGYAKDTSKQNIIKNKAIQGLANLDVRTSQDKLRENSYNASIFGPNMKLASLAETIQDKAALQSALNDTAEEHGLVADDLAKGIIKFEKNPRKAYAKYGMTIKQAKNGDEVTQGKKIKKQFKLDKNVTRIVFQDNTIKDVRDDGTVLLSKKAGPNDVVDYEYFDSGSYRKTFGNNTKKTYFTNGRVAELDAKGNLVRKGNYDNTTDKITKWEPTEADKRKAANILKLSSPRNISDIAESNNQIFKNDQAAAAQKAPAPVRTVVQTTTIAPVITRKKQVGKAPIVKTPTPTAYVSKYGLTPWEGNKLGLKERTKSQFSAKEWDDIADNLGFTGRGNKQFQEFLLNNPDAAPIIKARHMALYGQEPSTMLDSKLGYGWAAADLKNLKKKTVEAPVDDTSDKKSTDTDKTYGVTPYKRSTWMDFANQVLPFIRPTDQEPLDPNQLMGEMYALGNNQVEPVQAQGYHPDLGVPYDISYQDMLNENQADYNATQKLVGNNPAALSALNAQKYAANSKVLAEQFRANQAMKDKVYSENRNTLNDSKLKNLDIFDKQYERQSQAVSNTKAVAQAALNSISEKYAQNKLENKTLGVYENMYNYRFDPSGRAINMNGFYQPNIPQNFTAENTTKDNADYVRVYDEKDNIIAYKKAEKTTARNGSIVTAAKNL